MNILIIAALRNVSRRGNIHDFLCLGLFVILEETPRVFVAVVKIVWVFLQFGCILLRQLFVGFIHCAPYGGIERNGFVQLDEKILCVLVIAKFHKRLPLVIAHIVVVRFGFENPVVYLNSGIIFPTCGNHIRVKP